MKIYLHLGIHKTATTYIQTNILNNFTHTKYINRNELKSFKSYILYTDDFSFDVSYSRQLFLNVVNKHPGYDSYILSEEEFYGNPYLGALNRKRILDRLIYSIKGEIYVLLFIRNQVDLLLSLYSYYVKSGGSANINEFMYYRKYPLIILSSYFEFDIYLNYIREKISGNNMKVILYEDFRDNPNHTISRILKFVNEPLLNIDTTSKRTNKSLSYSLLRPYRCLNMFVKSSKQPFLLFPKIFHGLIRKIFERIEVKDTNAKNRLLDFIYQNDEFMTAIKESNNRLMQDFDDLDIKRYDYPNDVVLKR